MLWWVERCRALSKNKKLVEYFLSEPYRREKENLLHIIAEDFVFRSTRFGAMDFDAYAEYAKKYYVEEVITIDWIQSKDDKNFGVAYTAVHEGKTIFGNLAVSVVDGKITALIE